jgi:hypothetical protein
LKKKIFILSIFTFFLTIDKIFTQVINPLGNSNVKQIKGRIINTEDSPVIFAHVVNIRRNYASITDSTGYFKMPVMAKDTIRITAIGFHTRFIEITNQMLSNDSLIQLFKLEKRTYDLPTVNIYELRWQVFKSEFMETKVEEDKTVKRISNWMANLVPSDELRMIFQGARGPGFSINYKSKSEKSKLKVAKLERKYAVIAPKFNDKLITNLTGLQGKEIYKFLQYCNFSEEFLIQSSEYEIIEQILIRWEEYKKKASRK